MEPARERYISTPIYAKLTHHGCYIKFKTACRYGSYNII